MHIIDKLAELRREEIAAQQAVKKAKTPAEIDRCNEELKKAQQNAEDYINSDAYLKEKKKLCAFLSGESNTSGENNTFEAASLLK